MYMDTHTQVLMIRGQREDRYTIESVPAVSEKRILSLTR